jgi:chorismate dehydratase
MKIGAVSYLNTKPLVRDLSQLVPAAQLTFDLPSRLADDLQRGALDVALIPSIEFLGNPEYSIVSDACIGCRGPVLSVKLFAKTPIDEIQSLALDEGSRTSAAMVQILLQRLHGVRPRLRPLPIGDGLHDATADAVLLIGDRAIQTQGGEYSPVWDLGHNWCQTFDTPFVFAVWAVRSDLADETQLSELAVALNVARDRGLAAIDQIAAAEHRHVGLTVAECVDYLRDNLRFRLAERELDGLELFRTQCLQLGLLKNDIPIRIYDCETAG